MSVEIAGFSIALEAFNKIPSADDIEFTARQKN